MNYLVCVDGGDTSVKAFNKCIDLLNKKTDHLYILAVSEDATNYSFTPYLDYGVVANINEANANRLRDTLKKYGQYCRNHNLEATLLLGHGNPKVVICEEADKLKIDVIVVARRNLSTLNRVFVGSTSKYVVENSNATVLVIKDDEKKDK